MKLFIPNHYLFQIKHSFILLSIIHSTMKPFYRSETCHFHRSVGNSWDRFDRDAPEDDNSIAQCKRTFVTLQTAACRMASKPPSGASRLRDTICFCTSTLKRSTLSVSGRTLRKPKVGTQLGNGLYLSTHEDRTFRSESALSAPFFPHLLKSCQIWKYPACS